MCQICNKEGMYEEAIEYCLISTNIIPSKLRYKYHLMNSYLAAQDSINAVIVAKEIIDQKKKGTTNVLPYKESAQKVIDEIVKK